MDTGIYKITNKITGCVYIGSSTRLRERISQYKKCSPYISKNVYDSLKEHGVINHDIKILNEFVDISRKELHNYEDVYIRYYVHTLGEDKVLNSFTNMKDWINPSYIKNNIQYQNNNKTSKIVIQYNSDGLFIKEWESLMEINRVTGFNFRNISSVCRGKRNIAHGFIWKYKDISPQEIAVNQYDLDGNFIQRFESMSDAGRFFGKNNTHIWEVCKGKLNSTLGFKWEYADK